MGKWALINHIYISTVTNKQTWRADVKTRGGLIHRSEFVSGETSQWRDDRNSVPLSDLSNPDAMRKLSTGKLCLGDLLHNFFFYFTIKCVGSLRSTANTSPSGNSPFAFSKTPIVMDRFHLATREPQIIHRFYNWNKSNAFPFSELIILFYFFF